MAEENNQANETHKETEPKQTEIQQTEQAPPKNSGKSIRRRSRINQIHKARQSIEYREGLQSVEKDSDVTLSKRELEEIQEIAESPEEAAKLEQDAIAAKKNIAALRQAKAFVNKSVPAEKIIHRPGYGEILGTAEYHTEHAYRFLLGRAQYMAEVDGKKQRKNEIIGLFEAASAIKHIEQGYQSGCPYATWTLVKVEEKMKQLKLLFAKAKEDADKLIDNAMLISTKPFTSRTPAEIKLDFVSSYAYHFANFLSQYDLLLRPLVTGKILGFISDDEFRQVERKMGTPLRALFRLVSEWEYVGNEAVETRNARCMEAEHKMGILPKPILNGELKPQLAKTPKSNDE